VGLQRFPLSAFQGGLNIRDAPHSLKPGEAQEVLNVTLAQGIGNLTKRQGKVRFDQSGLSETAEVDHLRPWYSDASTRFLMASVAGKIYRLTTGGIASLLFTGTVGTTWSFEQMSNGVGAQMLWAMNGVDTPKVINAAGTVANWANSPPNGSILRLWKNRMCVAGVSAFPTRIYFSDIGDPELPAAAYGTNFVDIRGPDDDLDPITWLEAVGDFLVVFKKKTTYLITVSNPPWNNKRVAAVGCEDRFQSVQMNDKCYFFNRRGIYSLDVSNVNVTLVDEETPAIAPWWTDVLHSRVNFGSTSKVRLGATPSGRILAALPLDGSSANNYLLELIPDTTTTELDGKHTKTVSAVFVHNMKVSSLCMFRALNQDQVVAGEAGGVTSKIHTLFSSLTDDGAAITAFWKSGWRGVQEEEPYERIRRVNIVLEGQIELEVYKDFEDTASFSKLLNVAPTSLDPLWDGGIWDDFGIWNASADIALVRARPETRGRYHAIGLVDLGFVGNWTVHTIELALRGGKEH
jgi:hypothetical protein